MRPNYPGEEVDFSKYDCTPVGAASAGASYAGTMIGFSDFYSGAFGTITQYQFQGTTVGGGAASDFKVRRIPKARASSRIRPFVCTY